MVNGVWQLVLESEWSPNRDTVIPYGITVKTRFGTNPQRALLVKINYGATALSFKCTRYTKSQDRLYKLMICGTITVSADKTCYFWSSFERLDLELVNCESNLGVCIKSKKVPRITAFEIDAQQHTKN